MPTDPHNIGSEPDKATIAKIEQETATKFIKLICQGRIGSPHSVKVDERNNTLVFEDNEIEFSLQDKEHNAIAKKGEYVETAKCL